MVNVENPGFQDVELLAKEFSKYSWALSFELETDQFAAQIEGSWSGKVFPLRDLERYSLYIKERTRFHWCRAIAIALAVVIGFWGKIKRNVYKKSHSPNKTKKQSKKTWDKPFFFDLASWALQLFSRYLFLFTGFSKRLGHRSAIWL